MPDWLYDNITARHLISTVLLIALLLIARAVIMRSIRRDTQMSLDLRRRWQAQVRTATVLFLLLGLLIIWGQQLQSFALSLAAIAVAVVVATKEIIMCISGSMVKATGHAFTIGDRIEVNNLRGDVVDQSLLTTTILEIGPGQATHQHTGRTIVLPNSIFLTSPVMNESFTDDYVLHVFTVPMKAEDDWRAAERMLLEAATEECRPFLEESRRHMERVGEKQGLSALSVEPRVTIQLPEPDKVHLMVRIPVPARRKGRIEQGILRRFLNLRDEAHRAKIAAEQTSSSETTTDRNAPT